MMVIYMYIAPGQGGGEVNCFSLTHSFSQFSPLLQLND